MRHTDAPSSIITRNNIELESDTGNIYEACVVLSKRADQLAVKMKQELDAKLEEFASHTDTLEEIFENREQIEVSRHYERLPKPVAQSFAELEDDEVYWRIPETEEAEA